MDLWFYIVSVCFLILLILYIINSRIDKNFRQKMVPLLKKQRKTIESLASERDNLSQKADDLNRELNVLQTKFSKQDDEYNKIHWLINTVFHKPFHDILGNYTLSRKENLTSESVSEQFKDVPAREWLIMADMAEWWFRKRYNKEEKEFEAVEITNLLQEDCDQLKLEFDYKKLSFIQHTGEPIMVTSRSDVISFVILTFGRLLGQRSMNGNSIYIDTEKTGKKCLVSMEDSSHGPDDPDIKALFSEIWLPGKLPEMEPQKMAPVILAKEIISLHQGNVWYSRVYEVGMKITFSIPLDKTI